MKMPHGAELIISRLNANGYRGDAVGGCVRDFLLGKVPNDYDITTDALPDEMRRIFSDLRTIDTGIKHGTLTVMVDSEPYEVTTYRIDGEYSDNRHPDKVSFTNKLSDDLSRRDFTVNAMCYNPSDGVTDIFGGREDLKNGVIRAVGDPVLRFSEDALRILRALRFAATLNFSIEPATSSAIFEKAHLLSGVSRERIYTEWRKLISGVGASRILREYGDVISLVIPELAGVGKISFPDGFLTADGDIRELSLFAITGTSDTAMKFESAMHSLRSDNKHKRFGAAILQSLGASTESEVDIMRLLVKAGDSCTLGVIKLKMLLGTASEKTLELYNKILSLNPCYRISDMDINGNDLSDIGIKGREIGEVLGKLLSLIADGKVKNEREELLAVAKALR